MHDLLQETTVEGRNAWYEACDALGQPTQFVSDLGRAWELAKKSYTEAPTCSIVRQCHYGLVKTSLNSLAQNIPAELIAAFVKNGFWSPAQGLAYAQQSQQDKAKASVIQALVPHLPESLLPKVLELVRTIRFEYSRANALIALAKHDPELYEEALAVTRAIQDESSRSSALRALAEHDPELYEEASAVTRAIQEESSRSDALSALAEHHPELYEEALAVTRAIQEESSRSDELRALAEHHPELYEEALAVTRAIQDESSRSFALRELAEYWLDRWIPTLVEEVRNLKGGYSRSKAFSALLPRLALNDIDPPFWQELLATLTCRTRKEFDGDIPKLAPAIVALGGEAALRGVVGAMRQVCGWWP